MDGEGLRPGPVTLTQRGLFRFRKGPGGGKTKGWRKTGEGKIFFPIKKKGVQEPDFLGPHKKGQGPKFNPFGGSGLPRGGLPPGGRKPSFGATGAGEKGGIPQPGMFAKKNFPARAREGHQNFPQRGEKIFPGGQKNGKEKKPKKMLFGLFGQQRAWAAFAPKRGWGPGVDFWVDPGKFGFRGDPLKGLLPSRKELLKI